MPLGPTQEPLGWDSTPCESTDAASATKASNSERPSNARRVGHSPVELARDCLETYGGLALDTLLPTPSGMTTVAQVQIGDKLIGASGRPVTVSAKSNISSNPCFEITLSDGNRIQSDANQLWRIDAYGHIDRILSTSELEKIQSGSLNSGGLKKNLRLGNVQPLHLHVAALPIDPYIVGAWLGDGTAKLGEIAIGWQDYDEMMLELSSRWKGILEPRQRKDKATIVTLRAPRPDICPGSHPPASFVIHYGYWRCRECRGNPMLSLGPVPLHRTVGLCRYNHPESHGRKTCQRCFMGLYRWSRLESKSESLLNLLKSSGLYRNKMIPPVYLRASRDQCLELLRGLMDTDGHWHPVRKRAVFVNTNENLARGVAELARSLGVTVTWYKKKAGNAHKAYFMVEFNPLGFNPFSLPRKARQVTQIHRNPVPPRAMALWRYVRSIEQLPASPTQAIAVHSHDNLFLAGTSFIVAQGFEPTTRGRSAPKAPTSSPLGPGGEHSQSLASNLSPIAPTISSKGLGCTSN